MSFHKRAEPSNASYVPACFLFIQREYRIIQGDGQFTYFRRSPFRIGSLPP